MATVTFRAAAGIGGTTWKAEYYGISNTRVFEVLDSDSYVIRQIFYGNNLSGWSGWGNITGIDYFDSSGNLDASYRNLDLTMSQYNSLLTIGTSSENFQNYLLRGNDTIKGSKYGDVLRGSEGRDTIDGGAGSDTISFRNFDYSVSIDLTRGLATPNGGTTRLISIENAEGSAYADKLTGSSGSNIFQGFGGDDVIDGKGGFDTAIYRDSASRVVADLASGAVSGGSGNDTLVSIENLVGTRFNDVLRGNSYNNSFDGFLGNDIIDGRAGFDTIDYSLAVRAVTVNLASGKASGGAGYDALTSIEGVRGSVFNDSLNGSSAANSLWGDEGNDLLRGGDGRDKLYGDEGNDRLYGGLHADYLYGGSGMDIFVFDAKLGAGNIDIIVDFSAKDDTIWIDDDIFTKAGNVGDLSTAAYHTGTKAHDASDRVIYDNKSGKLWYDADGSGKGAAVQFAQLDKGLKLTAADFDIIG